MAHQVEKQQGFATDSSDALSMVRNFSRPITVIDSTGQHHSFQKFEWLGRWGICNAAKTQIFVKAQSDYHYVDVLVSPQRLIAGNKSYGWDVYSLTGELLQHFSQMSPAEIRKYLGA